MRDFRFSTITDFNSSQYQALSAIEKMGNFLLIQGPPGTGKTHTIKGMISMLCKAMHKDKKILVCAPSNAAIDEIVTRLVSTGLLKMSAADTVAKTLRIGALEHEPNEYVSQVIYENKFNQMADSQIAAELQ